MQPTLFFKCRPSARTCVRHCGTRTSTAPLETDFYEKLRQLLVCVLLETQVGPRCFQRMFFPSSGCAGGSTADSVLTLVRPIRNSVVNQIKSAIVGQAAALSVGHVAHQVQIVLIDVDQRTSSGTPLASLDHDALVGRSQRNRVDHSEALQTVRQCRI